MALPHEPGAGLKPAPTKGWDRRAQLRRGGDGEALAGAAHVHLRGCAIAFDNVVHTGAARPVPARIDHAGDNLGGSLEQRLHVAVAAIAHPALESEIERGHLRPGAVGYSLHASANEHVPNGAHVSSPVSFARAPAQRDADQRLSDEIYAAGSSHSRAASKTTSRWPGRGVPLPSRRAM